MTSELSDGNEIATGIAVLPSGNVSNIPPNMPIELSMSHSQPITLQQRLQPTAFMNWIPSHLPLQMDPNFDPNNIPHANQVMAIPYPVHYQNQYFQSTSFPQNYSYQPFVTHLETRFISIPTVNTLPSIQLPSQNTPNDIHSRSDSHLGQGPSPVNIPLNINIPHGNGPIFDFNIDTLQYPHDYMNSQMQDDMDQTVSHANGSAHSKAKRSQPKKPSKVKSPPPKAQPKKQPRGKDDESVDKAPQSAEVASDMVDDLVIFSAAHSEAVTQPPHIQEQLAKYKMATAPPSGEPSQSQYNKSTHIKGPKVCCALGCEQVITKRRLCARHQKQKERNGGKISLKPEMEVGPTPVKRKKEEESGAMPSPTSAEMTAVIKLDYAPPPLEKPPKLKKTPRKKSPKKKIKQELDANEAQLSSGENGENGTRYGTMNNTFMNNPTIYEANRSMLSQSGSLEDMFQSQDGTDVSEPHSDTSNDQLCDNYFKEIL